MAEWWALSTKKTREMAKWWALSTKKTREMLGSMRTTLLLSLQYRALIRQGRSIFFSHLSIERCMHVLLQREARCRVQCVLYEVNSGKHRRSKFVLPQCFLRRRIIPVSQQHESGALLVASSEGTVRFLIRGVPDTNEFVALLGGIGISLARGKKGEDASDHGNMTHRIQRKWADGHWFYKPNKNGSDHAAAGCDHAAAGCMELYVLMVWSVHQFHVTSATTTTSPC